MKKVWISLIVILINVSLINAQSKVVPIVEMKVGALLGGVQNGKFLDAKTTVAKLAAKKDYKLFLFDGTIEDLSLIKPADYDQGGEFDNCPNHFAINLSGKNSDEEFSEGELETISNKMERGGVALGKGFDWKPQPRSFEQIGLNNAEYKKIFGDFLLAKKIAKHELKLKQAVRVDLDGDGQNEVLLVASRYFPYTEKDGKKAFDEYSVVLLRKIINGKVQTIFVTGEFYPKNTGDYDGNFFEISSILDLNGDGKMEVVIYSSYYEGSSSSVFDLNGSKPTEIKQLTAGCGV